MKKTIMTMAALCAIGMTTSAVGAESQHPCDYPIMHAYTVDGDREVKLCASGDNISYTFGKIKTEKPELDILVPIEKSEFYSYENGSEEATLTSPSYVYTVSNLIDESNHPIKEIIIHKDYEVISHIKLSKFEYSRITHGNLGDFNIDVLTN